MAPLRHTLSTGLYRIYIWLRNSNDILVYIYSEKYILVLKEIHSNIHGFTFYCVKMLKWYIGLASHITSPCPLLKRNKCLCDAQMYTFIQRCIALFWIAFHLGAHLASMGWWHFALSWVYKLFNLPRFFRADCGDAVATEMKSFTIIAKVQIQIQIQIQIRLFSADCEDWITTKMKSFTIITKRNLQWNRKIGSISLDVN